MGYRVFIGSWDDGDPDWTAVDRGGLDWDSAKNELESHLRRFENDDCEACRQQAAEELARLQSSPPGRFDANVDGDDYLILPE